MTTYSEFIDAFFTTISNWLYPEERIMWNNLSMFDDDHILTLLIFLTYHPKSRRIFRGKEMSMVEFKQLLVQKAIELSKHVGFELYDPETYMFLSESFEMMNEYTNHFENIKWWLRYSIAQVAQVGIQHCSLDFLHKMYENSPYERLFDPYKLMMLYVRLGLTHKIDEQIANTDIYHLNGIISYTFKIACIFNNYNIIYYLQHKYNVVKLMLLDDERCWIFSVHSFRAGMHFFKKFIGNFWNSEKINPRVLLETLCFSNNSKTIPHDY